ncbi:hypothetical protein ACFPYN_11875 [Paenisporosarcina macmurdoensis]|uniref:PspA/IM30 family protein n=1 Tax=Paenisporosarcina macmurdoensis TaxID=212659 RepID=A0ABW1L8S4_9BACL
MNFLEKMSGLFKKIDEIDARYEKALQEKEQSLLVLQSEIQNKQKEVTELHKMKIFGDITESFFDEKNEAFLKLQAKYRQSQTEVEMIKQYGISDVTELMAEIETTRKEHSVEESKAIRALKVEALQAKETYLKTLHDVGIRHNKAIAPSIRFQHLQKRLGLVKNVYITDTFESLNTISVNNGGYVNLRVEQIEVHEAIKAGTMNGDLRRVLKEARENGTLK